MGLPKLEGCITIPSAGWACTIVKADGNHTISLPAGTYYMSTSDSTSYTLVSQWEAKADDTGHSFTASLSATTGRVTLTDNSGSNKMTGITWTATDLRDALGFSGSESFSGGAVTGAYQARYLFMPNCGRGPQYMAPDGADGAQESDLTMAVSPSGHIRCYGYETRYVDVLDFPQLQSAKTWIADEVTVNESLQKFWQDVMSSGARFRYHPDGTVAGTYVTWVADAPAYQPKPLVPGWDNAVALWGWSANVRKYVA